MIRVTVWNEMDGRNLPTPVKAVYPLGIQGTLAAFLNESKDIKASVASLEMPECGLPDPVLENTDVLIWWGHSAHDRVPDELAAKVADRVLSGMGLIVLHSGHYSKPFRRLMGTTCSLRWRDNDFERLWCVNPGHPITEGVPASFELPAEEMYGEHFDVPAPDEQVYLGWFRGGEVFRSVCCWHRGAGKVVYIQPGHETNPAYHNPCIQQIITNSVRWARPVRMRSTLGCFHTEQTTEEIRAGGGEIDQY